MNSDNTKEQHLHEAWWLIESTFAPRTLYFAGCRRDGKAPVMVDDASKAVRFPSQDAALFTVCHTLGILPVGGGFTLEHMGYVVREHIFDYTPAASRLAGQGEQPALVADLHAQIMNLPWAYPPDFENDFERRCYREGHRDARHAAAELVSASAPAPAGDAPIEELMDDMVDAAQAVVPTLYRVDAERAITAALKVLGITDA